VIKCICNLIIWFLAILAQFNMKGSKETICLYRETDILFFGIGYLPFI